MINHVMLLYFFSKIICAAVMQDVKKPKIKNKQIMRIQSVAEDSSQPGIWIPVIIKSKTNMTATRSGNR